MVALRLGVAKDIVLSALLNRYDLVETNGSVSDSSNLPDDWQVQDRSHKTPADKVLGFVRFRSGKLTSITEELTPEDREYTGPNVAEIIYTVTSKFVREGNTICRLQTWSSQQQSGPGHLEFRETHITCGRRQLEIIISWQSAASWVQVRESLSEPSEISEFDIQ